MYAPTVTSATAVIQEATDLIVAHVRPLAIFVIGSHHSTKCHSNTLFPTTAFTTEHYHFYMVVFCAAFTPTVAADTCDIIRTSTGGRLTATLLLHKATSLKPRATNQHAFFCQVLQHAPCVYQHAEKPVYLDVATATRRDIDSSRCYWMERYLSAKLLLGSAAAVTASDAEILKVTYLHQATGLLCLGLIEVYLGYSPNHYSLGFLFELCDYFSNCTQSCFPRQNPTDQKLFKLLCTPPHALRHKRSLKGDALETRLLESRCQQFLEATAAVAAHHLDNLTHEIL